MNDEHRDRQSEYVVNLGLVSNIFLSIIKTSVGILGHSQALLADGINSTSDVAYYIVVKVFMRLAGKPADPEHPYGHSQLESIAALVVGAFVISTSIAVFWNAVDTLFDMASGGIERVEASGYTFWIAAGTVVLKIGLYVFSIKAGRGTNNPALMALAYDHRNDIFSALAAAIGIFLARSGHPWVDPLAGAVVAFVILRTGVEIMRGSSLDLMDTVPGHALSERIRGLMGEIPEVRKVEEIYAHRFGPYLVVNITICIEGSLSVEEGDRISTLVEEKLYGNIDFLRKVHVHYHPLV